MFSMIRRHLSYANVAATLALVFSMSGGALAAKHYLINSPKQINPKVLRKLIGQTGKNGGTGPTGPAGPAGPTGVAGPTGQKGTTGAAGASATALWAVVSSNGTLVRGSGATAANLSRGYEVTFNRDVSGCAYEATLGTTGAGTGLEIGYATVAPGFNEHFGAEFAEPEKVDVTTFNTSGQEANSSFHLAVFC